MRAQKALAGINRGNVGFSKLPRGEARYYMPVAAHFETKGYAVKTATHHGDILAYDKEAKILVSVEVKPHDARDAIGQAYSATDFADFIYAAIPTDGEPRINYLERLGIGLLLVNPQSAEVTERLSPRKNVPFDKDVRDKLVKRCFAPPRDWAERKEVGMGIRGGWSADELAGIKQKGGWEDIFSSLNLTEKQRDAVIAILNYFRLHGLEYGFLKAHGNSKKEWPGRFLTKRAAREMAVSLERDGVCSYRYAWYILQWLIENGWVDPPGRGNKLGPMATVRGRNVKGYAFSARVLKYARDLASKIPALWEAERPRPVASPKAKHKRPARRHEKFMKPLRKAVG